MKTGVGIEHFGPTHLSRMLFLCPPPDEQLAITRWIEEGSAPLDNSIRNARAAMGFAAEYRTRLIADVVTGKLDVREAAARLPEETDEPEPLDDLDLPDEELDALDADEVEAELAEAMT